MSLALEVRRSLCDAQALLRALGLDGGAQRQARGRIVRCPAHDDSTPSCSVRKAKDGTIAVKCHGCDWSGDALDLIAIRYGLDVRRDHREVLRIGAELAGRWDLIEELDRKGPRRAPRVLVSLPPLLQEEPTLAAARYHAIADALLRLCPLAPNGKPTEASVEVVRYLEGRGLLADAQSVGIGALPPARLQRSLLDELRTHFSDEELVLGGIVERTGDRLRHRAHRVLIPWRLSDGTIACLQRRSLDGREPRFVFPPDRAPREPFGAEYLAAATDYLGPDAEVIVTESALDALARRRLARLDGQLAIVLGLSGATPPEEMVDALVAMTKGRRIVLATDADKAGEACAQALAVALRGTAVSIARERPVGAKDFGEVLERTGS